MAAEIARDEHAAHLGSIASAYGWQIVTEDGRELTDLTSFFGVSFCGHAHPRIVSAIKSQADRVVHGMGALFEADLAEDTRARLRSFMGLTKWDVSLCVTGSEAIENAIKIAQGATGRAPVAVIEGGFHGASIATLAVCGHADLRATARIATTLPLVEFVPYESIASVPGGDSRVEALSGQAACLIVEPMQNLAGYRMLDSVAIRRLVSSAKEQGTMIVVDEIFTGGGRCGAALGMDALLDIREYVDIVCVGKALSGGVPFSACATRPGLTASAVTGRMIGVLGSTFSANPLACAAAGAAIDVIQDEALVDRALGLEQVFARRYDAFSDLSNVVDFRGAGAAWALELKPSEDDGGGRLANAVARTMLESHGVLTITTGSPAGNVVALCPPAVLPPEVLENVLDQLLDAVASVEV